MNEKDFFKEATKEMIVDLKGMDMNNIHKEMNVKSGKRLCISVYSKAAAIIIVCVISLGTVGVGASALYHRWSDGIRDRYHRETQKNMNSPDWRVFRGKTPM